MSNAPKSVLIVDDEPAARAQLREVIGALEELEVVAEVSDGSAAIEAIEQHTPDIVFLDILMPGMDGLEVLRRLRTLEKVSAQRRGHHIPIIMVTGVEDLSMVKAAYTELCDGYLTKPVQAAKLHKLLEEILVGRRS